MEETIEGSLRDRYALVFRFVRRRSRDAGRAEDLTQQVFADAAAAFPDSARAPLRWLYTVARRRLVDEARRGARRSALLRLPEAREDDTLAASLRSALARLPEGQREVVVLKLIHGLRFAEIAELVDATEDATKMRFVRALRTLRDELRKEGVHP